MAYVVFDVETTGLSPEMGDRIIEIAAVRVHNGVITQETFEKLVNPHRIIPSEAVGVHGITNEMLKDAPEIEVVLHEFLDFIKTDTLVAHNAEFDIGFLHWEMKRMGLDPAILPPSICTVELSKKKNTHLNRHNLDAITADMGIVIERRHRALDDVIATAEVFLHLHDEAPSLF